MLRIFETVFDASGVILSRQALGAVFLHRLTAARFLNTFLPQEFANGRCGYDCPEDYWWGCYDESEATVRRYTIEGDSPVVTPATRATAGNQPELEQVG